MTRYTGVLNDKAASIVKDLFGVYSLNDIKKIGEMMGDITNEALKNPKNTIGSLSSGIIII